MLTGGIDISVGSLVAMDCMILAVGMERWNMNAVLLCILVLAIGIVFGVVQGFCVGYLNIQPFIVTMAGMFFARGMTAVISTEQISISSNAFFVKLANTKISLPFGSYTNNKGVVQVPFIGNRGAARADSRIFHAPLYQVRQKPLRSRRK